MGSLRGGGALCRASGERRSSDEGVRPEHLPGFSSLPLWLPFFFFPLLSLPLPFLFVKGGGRQRRAGVSGRGLEFHLNDCPSAHAAPRSRPARALQPAAGRPAGGRPRHGLGTAGAPRSPTPDPTSLGAAELAIRGPRTSAGSQARKARLGPARRQPPSPRPPPKEECGSPAPCAAGRAPMSAAGPSAGRGTPLL